MGGPDEATDYVLDFGRAWTDTPGAELWYWARVPKEAAILPSERPRPEAASSDASGERERGSGVRLVYELLREEILRLELEPGSIVDEASLADRFGMSRTPIREALVRLTGEGLVKTLPNRSTIVSPLDFPNVPSYFDALVLMYRATTKLAARRHDAADLRAIRARQAEFSAAVRGQDALAMIATNASFHLAIADAGRNPYFNQLFGRLLDEGRRMLRLYYRSFDDRLPRRFVDEHEDIITAVADRDGELADRLAEEHGKQIVEQLRKLLVGEERLSLRL